MVSGMKRPSISVNDLLDELTTTLSPLSEAIHRLIADARIIDLSSTESNRPACIVRSDDQAFCCFWSGCTTWIQ
jgi:hypothetical protein